jgi:hypothetical protein
LDGGVKGSSVITILSADIIRPKKRDEELKFAAADEGGESGSNGVSVHGRVDRMGHREEDRCGVRENGVEAELGV